MTVKQFIQLHDRVIANIIPTSCWLLSNSFMPQAGQTHQDKSCNREDRNTMYFLAVCTGSGPRVLLYCLSISISESACEDGTKSQSDCSSSIDIDKPSDSISRETLVHWHLVEVLHSVCVANNVDRGGENSVWIPTKTKKYIITLYVSEQIPKSY